MKVSELLNSMEYEFLQGADCEVSGINYDSRNVAASDMFLCISGYSVDGHDYANQAAENGAICIVCERDINLPSHVTIVKVADTRRAMAVAAANLQGQPSKKMRIIGVTGTNGKTSTTYFLEAVLKAAGSKVGLIGTIENKIGDEAIPSTRTTPESADLQQLFAKMHDAAVTDVAMEVSSHSLYLKRVDVVDFDIAIFTNLTQEHLDFHKTMENYRMAKMKLFEMAKRGVINADDEYAKYFIEACEDAITVGIDNPCDYRAYDVEMTAYGVSFSLDIDGVPHRFELPVPGKFTVYNALGVIGASLLAGIDVKYIKEGLKNTNGVPGRIQNVRNDKGFAVIVDYAHSPDGLENVISAVREFTPGRVITVFGCGGDRDATKRPIMGNVASKLSDYCVVTTDNPRTENPEAIIDEIVAGIQDGRQYVRITDRREAICYAIGRANPEDSVIIAGKGHENYQEVHGIKHHFDDFEEAKAALDAN